MKLLGGMDLAMKQITYEIVDSYEISYEITYEIVDRYEITYEIAMK